MILLTRTRRMHNEKETKWSRSSSDCDCVDYEPEACSRYNADFNDAT